jgi:hypothetical protein
MGGAGMAYSTIASLWSDEASATHEWDTVNRVHIFQNNPLGYNGTAGTLGHTINFMRYAGDINAYIDSYAYREAKNKRDRSHLSLNPNDHQVHYLTHELKHRDQGSYMGIFFLPIYGIFGGASADNWMEKQADRAGHQIFLNNTYGTPPKNK